MNLARKFTNTSYSFQRSSVCSRQPRKTSHGARWQTDLQSTKPWSLDQTEFFFYSKSFPIDFRLVTTWLGLQNIVPCIFWRAGAIDLWSR